MKTTLTIIAILILSGISMSFNGLRIISGTVSDENGQALHGVTVSVKNSKAAVITNHNGKYSINIRDKDNTLIFSFIGYQTIEKKIGKRSVINVKLQAEIVEDDLEVAVEEINTRRKIAISKPWMTGRQKGAKANYFMTAGVSAYDNGAGRWNNNFNTEGYTTIHENGYKSVTNNPLSTFSIDVDRASYSNIRRFINQGQRPPIDAVRIEEMVNYFKYNYPEPDGKHPFSVYTEIASCPWQQDHLLLHIGLKGKSIDKTELPASNLVFLLDVSGSMNSPNKLPLLKSAFRLLVNELRPQDKVSIVVYAGAAGVVLEPTQGNIKENILQAIERLNAGGSTAGGEGIQLAYKLAGENFVKGGNNRIILATDGDFNIGASSNAEMERLIEKKRNEGIFITVLGFGMGNYKDDKMEIIADKGNGNYAYIDNIQEARKILVSEFGGTLFTIAKDVKFQIEFNPVQIKSYRLIGYENRLLNDEDFNDDKKDAGEMGAGHTVTAIYELVPAGADEAIPSIDPLKYSEKRVPAIEKKVSAEFLTIKLRYKKPDGNKSILMEKALGDKVIAFNKASENLRFSAAVAGFGMVLRESEHKGSISLNSVIEMAISAKGDDTEGYRGEFIRLAKAVRDLNFITE